MTQVENLNLYFIFPSENSDENDCSDDMKAAYEVVVRYGGNAEWMLPSFCMDYKPKEKDVFIFENFEGTAFEKMKEQKGKVLGARCLLTCVSNGRSIPPGVSPIFTEGMRDLIVCSSGFDKETKKLIEMRVQYMGGVYDQSLRSITTHMVAHNNISKKAINCYKNGKPIMTFEWIEAVWSKSLIENVNGKDEEFKKFASPLFHNLKITTSGIPRGEKDKLIAVIKQNGGTFTGTMYQETSIVILSKPEGDKYNCAQTWNIPCLRPTWIYDCVKTNSILQLSDYSIEFKKPKASTPKKFDVNLTANFSMISNIGFDPDKQLTHVDETVAGLTSNTTIRCDLPTPQMSSVQPEYADAIDYILLKKARESGQFLDGCNIYLSGFNAEYSEKLRKVLNMAGATRFNELSASVTHIIVGNSKDNKNIAALGSKGAYVLPIEWLVKCVRTKHLAPESDFTLSSTSAQPLESPSPLSKQGAKLLSRIENKTVNKPSFCLEPPKSREIEDELLNKYNESQPGEPISQPQQTPTRSSVSNVSKSNSNSLEESIFKDLNFFLSSELSEEEYKQIEEVIVERGGRIIGKRFSGIPDYAIVPITGALLQEMTTKEVVNFFFIKDCCLEKTIVPLQYYHQPVTFIQNALPLKDCVISVSNYVQCEREFIELLIDNLGAVCPKQLARRSKNGVPKSTHLVCAEPNSQKYDGALRWGIPVVHHDWLLKCAAMGTRVSEQDYLVGDSKLIQPTVQNVNRTEQSFAPTSQKVNSTAIENRSPSNAPTILEPAPLASKIGMSYVPTTMNSLKDSPAVHSAITRLKMLETPKNANSPDPNRTITPTSPYGAFYGNENPSPGTRKRLLRWMQQGAEFPQDSPSKIQDSNKRDSTPISELLSRQLILMKRKPEEFPPDSPLGVPTKRPNLESKEVENCVISTGLQKMKEIEENYTKKCIKSSTPVRKSHDNAQPQMLIVTESQPHTEIGWEDPTEKEVALGKLEKAVESELATKIFMLSCLDDDVEILKQIIEDSGGKVSALSHFDRNATHLITGNMRRGEKLVCSIAAGLWVLHPSYIEQLRTVRNVHAINEEDYEWGNPNQSLRIHALSAKDKDFAQYSYFWRNMKEKGKDPPFKDMKIIVHLPPSKSDSFKRLIEAGGGELVNVKPPFSGDIDATVCVSDLSVSDEVDMESLARQRIALVSLVFINDQILQAPNAIQNNLLPNFVKYWFR